MPSVRTCFILCLEKDYGLVEVLKNQPAFAYWVDHGSPKGKGFSTHKVRIRIYANGLTNFVPQIQPPTLVHVV